MQELYTRAWVLDRVPVGEADELVTLYTEQFGKIRARARSIRKITSKVSSQLQPLGFSRVRLIRRNGPRDEFAVLDALAEARGDARLIPIARLILNMTHEWEVDTALWEYIEKIQERAVPEPEMYGNILSILGFDHKHATCMMCGATSVRAFVAESHDFACELCASKMNENKVVLI